MYMYIYIYINNPKPMYVCVYTGKKEVSQTNKDLIAVATLLFSTRSHAPPYAVCLMPYALCLMPYACHSLIRISLPLLPSCSPPVWQWC